MALGVLKMSNTRATKKGTWEVKHSRVEKGTRESEYSES